MIDYGHNVRVDSRNTDVDDKNTPADGENMTATSRNMNVDSESMDAARENMNVERGNTDVMCGNMEVDGGHVIDDCDASFDILKKANVAGVDGGENRQDGSPAGTEIPEAHRWLMQWLAHETLPNGGTRIILQ